MKKPYFKVTRDLTDYYLNRKLWEHMCLKYNHPMDKAPEFLGAGIEMVTFALGDKHVMKLSPYFNTLFNVDRVAKLNSKVILPCLDSFSISCDDKPLACVIQERCIPVTRDARAPRTKQDDETSDFIMFLYRISTMIYGKSFGDLSDEASKIAHNLHQGNVSSFNDLHSANVMKRLSGEYVITDYGCILFE